jgi:hypothetical protein
MEGRPVLKRRDLDGASFHRWAMQRVPLALGLVVLLLTFPVTSALDPTEETVIGEDTIVAEDTAYGGDLTVTNGATLTVNAVASIAQGAMVRVDEGATLRIASGEVSSNSISAFVSFSGTASSILLPVAGLTGTTTVRMIMHEDLTGNEQLNLSLEGGTNLSSPEGGHVDLQVDLDGSASTISLNVTHLNPFPFGPERIELVDGSANQVTIQAWDMEGEGLVLTWGAAAFSLEVYGSLEMTDAVLLGADLHCKGACTVEQSQLVGSAPVIVDDAGRMTIRDSTVLGSRTDEDIVAVDDADLVYENNVGTGGWTDNWIRRLSSREVRTNMPGALIAGADLGYLGSKSPNAFAIETDGAHVADFSDVESNLIVEWMDGSGVYGSETGTWTVSAVTGWGTYSTSVPAPWSTSVQLDLELPAIRVVSVEPEARTGDANVSLGVMLTVVNEGSVRADSPVLECTVDGEAADTSPGYIQLATYGGLDPGQEVQIPLTWRSVAGSHALTCGVLDLSGTNLESLEDLVAPGGATSSVEVSFTDPEEASSTPFATIGIALAILFLGAAGIARVAGASMEAKSFDEEDLTAEP